MTAKKKSSRARESAVARLNGRELPLRGHAERALSDYFTSLNGHRPAHLYDLVLREVENCCFAWCSTMRKEIKAVRPESSESIAVPCVRS